MDPLTAARAQMEVSLGFHMLFAAAGIAMPALMLAAEGLWLRTGQEHYRDLARKWAKATGLLFAIGAVSGTALSFELGLLWPEFMQFSGPIIGPGFALEGYAFFVEAIFIGLYLYGWDRLSPRAHWWTGVPVALSGLASGVLVVAVNAWMQNPGGFVLEGGRATQIDPVAIFKSPAWLHMSLHSSLSTYEAVGFAVAGIYAMGLLRGRNDAYHRSGLRLAMAMAAISAVLQPVSGHFSAQSLAELQPVKLAAMEGLFRTQSHAPITLGGVDVGGELRYGLEIPSGLSILTHDRPDAVVRGLEDFPRDTWPNVTITHLAFDAMVGAGFALLLLAAAYWWLTRRGREPKRWLLRAVVLGSPLGFVALEAGWIVTEVGRQPWVIRDVMRTADAVTKESGLLVTFWGFSVLYAALGATLVLLLLRLARTSAKEATDVS